MFVKEIFNYDDFYNSKYFRNYANSEALFDKNKDSIEGECSYEKNKDTHKISYEGGFRALKKSIDPRGATYLDIGCAEGYGVELAKNFGAIPYGLDVSKDAVEKCRESGLGDMFVGELSSCRFSNIKMATMIDVLEHMQDPVSNLRALNRIMETGGFVFVKNNLFSLDLFMNDNDYFLRNFEPPYHCSYFSESKMVEIFNDNGFKLVYRRPNFVLHVFQIYGYLKGLFNRKHRDLYMENKKKRLPGLMAKKISKGGFWGRKMEEFFPSGFVFKKIKNIS
ncbi:MAG: Methyltransferase type 11 [Parcubacteria group bacterium GW2011_GWF2_38_76]|nr:MAG: Methyltransferase type 11 [Parcubacteria group bacterium GW2011_GWF2_38_76]